jgi:hypothetical protein
VRTIFICLILCFVTSFANAGSMVIKKKMAGGSETIDSYVSSNQNAYNTVHKNDLHGVGQTITGTGTTLTSFQFWIAKVGAPTGNATISVWAHTGTWGTSGIPTGSALATTTVDVSTISTTVGFVTATFGTPATLTNATHYVVTLVYNDASSGSGAYLNVGSDSTSPTHAGNLLYSTNGTAWTAYANEDNIFNATHTP